MSTESAKHILVVEDESHLAIGIKFNLEADGYTVSVAPDGPTALKLIESSATAIDLVILDLMLPGMSGYAVCETLRQRGHHLPILMLSARTLTEDRIRGFDVGADQYLQKPFDLDELLAMVRNLLSRRMIASSLTDSDEHVFRFGKASVNFRTFAVSVGERRLQLTQMEMKLLQFFVKNEGTVVSRSQLLKEVWGQPSSLNTRTIDNFIVRMRKYFEEDPASPRHFVSVRGAGYRFIRSPEQESVHLPSPGIEPSGAEETD